MVFLFCYFQCVTFNNNFLFCSQAGLLHEGIVSTVPEIITWRSPLSEADLFSGFMMTVAYCHAGLVLGTLCFNRGYALQDYAHFRKRKEDPSRGGIFFIYRDVLSDLPYQTCDGCIGPRWRARHFNVKV